MTAVTYPFPPEFSFPDVITFNLQLLVLPEFLYNSD